MGKTAAFTKVMCPNCTLDVILHLTIVAMCVTFSTQICNLYLQILHFIKQQNFWVYESSNYNKKSTKIRRKLLNINFEGLIILTFEQDWRNLSPLGC